MAKKGETKVNKGVERYKEYVVELGELSVEEKAHFEGILANEALAAKMGEGLLRQSAFSKGMQQLTSDRETVVTGKADNEKFRGELETWKTQNDTKVSNAMKGQEDARRETAAYKERMATLKTAHDLSDEDIAVPLGATTTGGGEAKLVDDKKAAATPGVTREDLVDNLAAVAEFDDIRHEHNQLFPGKRLVMRALIEAAMKNGKTLQQQWEDEFSPTERRETMATEKRTEEDAALTKATEERIRSDMATEGYSLPGGTASGRGGSPLLKQFKSGELTPDSEKGIQELDADRGVNAAVASFNSGEHREAA